MTKSDLELRAARVSAVCAFKLNNFLGDLRSNNSNDLGEAASVAQRGRSMSTTSDYASLYGGQGGSNQGSNGQIAGGFATGYIITGFGDDGQPIYVPTMERFWPVYFA